MTSQSSTSSSSDSDTRVFAGRFEYVKPLGKGAGGAVYLAEDLHNDRRRVALKVLSEDATEGVQGKMLRREFEILSKLNHSHLVRVYDYGGLPGGGVYLAEEYVDGFSLQDARALLAPEQHIDITRQVLLGLSYLHGMGMVHRDVKPANVMLLWLDDAAERPLVKLVDFGLSTMDPSDDTLRGGTRSYMAPEIIRGNKGEHRSDLFSLGVTLYYALCGVLPFGPRSKKDPPPTEEDLNPPPPHRYNPDVPLTLSRFTMVLLRQVSGIEYEDAGEALQALARDTETRRWRSGRTFANPMDVAAAPVLRGYFERGILGRRVGEHERLVELLTDNEGEGGQEEGGGGRLHLIRGGEKVGKSRLIADVVASLKLERRRVMTVECQPGMAPWELIYRLLRRVVEFGASRGLREIEYYESYLMILYGVSQVQDGGATSGFAENVEHDWIRQAFHDAVEAIAPERLVLVVEDLHCADIASRRFLAEWYDSDLELEPPDVMATWLADEPLVPFSDSELLEIHDIEGLTTSDVRRFFEGRLGLDELPEAWVEKVSEHADGRPGYLEEFCRTLIDEGLLRRFSVASWELDRDELDSFSMPESQQASFRRRFASAGASGREALEILSLFDGPAPWEAVRSFVATSGDSEQEVDETLQTLVRRYLARMQIETDGRYLELVDPVLGEVVRDLMSPSWKRGLHRRIGEYLRDEWREGGVAPEESASHFEAGQVTEESARMYEVAGDACFERSDFGDAHDHYRRALRGREAGPARAFLKAKLARVLTTLYDPGECRAVLHEARVTAERTALDWVINAVCLTGAEISLVFGEVEEVDDWLARLEDCLPSMSREAPFLELKARASLSRGRLDEAEQLIGAAMKRVEHFGIDDRRPSLLCLRARVEDWSGEGDRADESMSRALAEVEQLEDDLGRAEIRCRKGAMLRRRGNYEGAVRVFEEALDILSRGHRPDLWIESLLEMALATSALEKSSSASRYVSDAEMFAGQFGNEVLNERVRFGRAELAVSTGGSVESGLRVMHRALHHLGEHEGAVLERLEMTVRLADLAADSDGGDWETTLREARREAERLGVGCLAHRFPEVAAE